MSCITNHPVWSLKIYTGLKMFYGNSTQGNITISDIYSYICHFVYEYYFGCYFCGANKNTVCVEKLELDQLQEYLCI